MSYEKGVFLGRNPPRADQRDEQFAKFFADLGLTPEADPFAHEPDPGEQLAKVKGLLAKARELHGGDPAGLDLMTASVLSSTLGVPTMPVVASARPTIESCTAAMMGLSFFDVDSG